MVWLNTIWYNEIHIILFLAVPTNFSTWPGAKSLQLWKVVSGNSTSIPPCLAAWNDIILVIIVYVKVWGVSIKFTGKPKNQQYYCIYGFYNKSSHYFQVPKNIYSKTRIYQTRFFTNTWRISKCYQGPNVTPLTSMLNKLGYIELYISKTRIYRSFSEVPLPFKSMLITFHISNSSKSLESSQFRDQHTNRNQLTLLSFLTHICHSYIEHF